jgi:hypothetical protein
MKTNNFFYILIFLIFYNECRFGRGGGRNTMGRGNSHRRLSQRGRSSGIRSGKNKNNNYSHGGGHHNYNQYNAYGNFGSFGGSAAWGLGGLGMGLILGSAISSNSSNKNNSSDKITIINSYDDKNEKSNNYDKISKNLKLEIEKIKDLSTTINDAKKEIKDEYIPAFIKTYFSPYQKTEIIQKTSQELYGDFNKEKIDIVNFKGNQEIKIQIDSMRNNIQPNLKKLISMTNNENKDELEKIQNDLRIALKVLNQTIVDTVKKINQ